MPALIARKTPPQRRGPRAFRGTQPGVVFYATATSYDMVVEVPLSNLSIDADAQCGVVYRGVDQGHYWAAYVDKAASLVKLTRFVAGVETVVATAAWTPADTVELRAIAQASRHRVWVNQVLLIDTTDATLNYGYHAGLFSRNTTVVLFGLFYGQNL